MVVATAVALIVAVVGPLVAYLSTVRKLSGRIRNSDAEDLWAESKAIRDDYAQRIKDLETRLERLEAYNTDLTRENAELTRRVRVLEAKNAELKQRIAELEHPEKSTTERSA